MCNMKVSSNHNIGSFHLPSWKEPIRRLFESIYLQWWTWLNSKRSRLSSSKMHSQLVLGGMEWTSALCRISIRKSRPGWGSFVLPRFLDLFIKCLLLLLVRGILFTDNSNSILAYYINHQIMTHILTQLTQFRSIFIYLAWL